MRFAFTALICGGKGDNIWDYEKTVSGENMTISEALAKVESEIGYDEQVVEIYQNDQ